MSDSMEAPLPGNLGGGRWSRVLFVLVILVVLLVALFSTAFVYVRPYEYGVKQVNIGIRKGIQDKVYSTGFHFVKPFGMELMHRFPRSLQVYEMLIGESPKPRNAPRRGRAAHIQTSDGFFVDVDVSIVYRIADPVKVIRTIGPGQLYEDNGIIPKAEPALKDALGELTTEEFYNSPLRVERMMLAKDLLNEQLLEPKGIEVDHVLIRYFRYSDEIQKNIEDKKLKDQLVFKNQAEATAASEGATLKRIEEEGRAAVKIKLQEGEAYRVRRNAERDLYVRTKHAEGDLLVKLAEAKKTELKNDALRGAGSENLVGLRMADVLQGVEMLVLPSDGKEGVNPLDLRRNLDLFEVNQQGGQ